MDILKVRNTSTCKFAVIFCAVLSASFSFAAPSGDYLCYKPDSDKLIYPWDDAAKWFPSTGSSSSVNRSPTATDYVFLYSTKNNVAVGGKPMVVTNGVNAATGALQIYDASINTPGGVIGITVQNGGTMTNSGIVTIGGAGAGASKACGGRLIVENGGEWTANDNFYLGGSEGTSWLNIEEGGIFSCAQSGKEFLVGYNYGSGIVTNSGTMSVYDLFVGHLGTGVFVNKGVFNVSRKFTIARKENSTGHVILENGGTLSRAQSAGVLIAYGQNSTGILECNGDFTLANESVVVGGGANSTGRLVIGEGGVVSNVTSISIGVADQSNGSVELHGGSLWVNGSGHAIQLGSDGDSSTGRIQGYGSVLRQVSTLRIKFYGQVVADGGGVMHDLNLASIKTVGTNSTDNLNGCGTNGWYAANKGRLVYPRAQDCITEGGKPSHPTVGDYPNRTEPTVMNSFRYTLEANPAGTYYNFAELYAPDRQDIPAGLSITEKDVVAGVWRFGLSSATNTDGEPTPAAFGGMSITFRYDWRDMPEDGKVAVYRHDGSANGTWQRVSDRTSISSSDNTVTTRTFDSSSETWNAGWFAIVAETTKGLVISYR